MKHSRDKKKLLFLSILTIICIGVFLFEGLNARNFNYNISRRIPKVIAICMTGTGIAVSSMLFQTVTNNRILTPSILGLDSLYNFGQTLCIFVFGIESIMMADKKVNFLVSVMIMLFGTIILYRLVFKKGNNIFTLLLVGTVVGTLFRSMSSFMSVLIDPNDFIVLQGKMFASFNNINTDILILSAIIMAAIGYYIYKDKDKLDVMLLGRETAINLGVDHDKLSKKILLIVALLVSVSTALVGPITFLGILVVNLSYHLFNTYKHSYLMAGASLISMTALVGGQFIVERILNFSSTVSIIINFVGGIYFIYLLIKQAKN
ncbi:iron chelate uptake ABC transporter family permease subunit [uncultured Clostridium sp.]|uniref:iron chelate uptake ABC transporter family permease subunit n=1 Tax=uncultured Clostridium sp. TaxID=59620 RepID=UPI0025FC88C1|nr:iron chelate uptake ABC transporter family permease subunit [uncultured Clostridium sp.]